MYGSSSAFAGPAPSTICASPSLLATLDNPLDPLIEFAVARLCGARKPSNRDYDLTSDNDEGENALC